MVHHELTHVKANITILNTPSSRLNLNNNEDFLCAVDEIDIKEINLSPTIENITEYIAGFITRTLKKHINCDTCFNAIDEKNENNQNSFIAFKNRGGLIFPSKDVYRICVTAEKISKGMLENMQNKRNFFIFLVNECLLNVDEAVFENLKNHILDDVTFEDNHRNKLIKKIIELYLKIRINYFNTLQNMNLKGNSIRQKLNKTILFKNQ